MVGVSLGLGSELGLGLELWVMVVNMFGVMVRVNTSQNLNPDP